MFCLLKSAAKAALGVLAWAALSIVNVAPAAPRQDIIESPGHTDKIYLQSTDLLGAGRGWVWRMPLVVNALDPVLGIEVAGEPLSIPYQSRVALRPGVWLHEGENRVRVRAFTDTRVHERTFVVNVEPLEAIAALPGTTVNDQRILMFRPVEHGADILPPDALLEVGGGASALYDARLERPLRGALMYEFVIEVSAFSPIRWIKIAGQVVSRPNGTWAQAKAPVLVEPRGTVVEVQAATDLATATERFTLGLAATPIPGTRLYQADPPGYVKPVHAAPAEDETQEGEATPE
jgi:hypothetical protein